MPGQFIGRYRILQEVGRGGMAIVYKGEDPTLERLVAIKVLPPKFLRNAEARIRFRREAKVAARLDHPNIVKVYDVGEDEGFFHIVMEYLEGETLRDYIEQRQEVSLDECLSFVRQICLALDYAHNRKVVHRDIKPENIIVINRRIVKITDFGLAFVDNHHSVTQAGAIMGTIAYFSPEQARGEPCDARSDLYSLGVIMFELATGRLPFDATNPSDMIQKHLHMAPPSPLNYNPTLPPVLETIIHRMMAKDPFDRYQSAQEVLLELNKLSKRTLSEVYSVSHLLGGAAPPVGELLPTVIPAVGKESPTSRPSAPMEDPAAGTASPEAIGSAPPSGGGEGGIPAAGNVLPHAPPGEPRSSTEASDREGETELLQELKGLLAAEGEGGDLATMLKNEQLTRGGMPGESWDRFRNILDRLRRDKSVLGSESSTLQSPEDSTEIVTLKGRCLQCGALIPMGGDPTGRKCPTCQAQGAKQVEPSQSAILEAQAHLEAARVAHEQGNSRDALRQVLSALALNPKLAKTHLLHGRLLAEEGSLKEALDAFRRCLELEPEDAEAYERIGEIYFVEQRYEEALKHFRQSLLLEPSRPDLYCKIARVHWAWGNQGEARIYLEQALKLDQNHLGALKLYGMLLIEDEEWERAIKTFEVILTLDPGDLEAYQFLGEVYEKTNRLSLAVSYYEQALSRAMDKWGTAGDARLSAEGNREPPATTPGTIPFGSDHASRGARGVVPGSGRVVATLHLRLGQLLERQSLWEQAREEYEHAVAGNAADPEPHFRLAELYRMEEKVDMAIRELEQVVGLDPNRAEAHHLLGSLYLRRDQPDQARLHLEWTVALDPFNADSHHKLGQIYYQEDRTDQAIKACKSAISLDPYNPEYHETIGMVYYMSRQLEEAAEAIKKALTLDSQSGDYHKALGVIYEGSKRYEQAIKEYQQAIELNPDDALAHGLLGKAYYESGLLNMAIYQYQKSATLEPKSHLIHSLLGRAYTKQGRIDLAIEEFKKAIELAPRGDPKKSKQVLGKAYKSLGAAYLEQGELQSAIDMFNTASNLLPGDAELLRMLGNAHVERNDLDNAVSLLQESIKLAPDQSRSYADLAASLDLKEETELARKAIKKAIALDPGAREYHEFLGDLEERAGNPRAAIQAFRQCLTLGGEANEQYHWRLGRLYQETGQPLEAQKAFQKAIRINGGNWHYYKELAHVEEELGNRTEALRLLEEARRRNPDSEFLALIDEELERLRRE